jgi:MFS family permease
MGFLDAYKQYRGLSKSVYVIFFARMINNMGAFIWPLLTLIFSRKMGYTPTQISTISVVIMLLYLPANIIGGKLADKFDRKKVIVIFSSISIVLFMSCSLLEPGNLMTVFFVLTGLFSHLAGPSMEALIADSSKPNEREKVYSLAYLGLNLGYIFGAAIGGLLVENHLSLAFLIDGTTTLISTVLIILFVKKQDVSQFDESQKNVYEDHIGDKIGVWQLLKDRKSVLLQIFIFALGSFIYDQWSFVLPLYLGNLFDEKGSAIYGFLGSFNGFLVILLTPIITLVFTKYKELSKVLIGMLLYSASYLVIKGNPAVGIFFVMMTLFTIGEIVNTVGASPYISRRIPASHRGRIAGFRSIAYMLGSILGRIVLGKVIEVYSFDVVFNMLAIVGIIAALLISINIKMDKKDFPILYEK